SSWKGRSETEEERQERYQIQQEKRGHEKQVKEKQIESDLKFAKERYGTTGVYSYPIPDNALSKVFKISGAILRVNITDVVRYEHTDNEFKAFYRSSKLMFSEGASKLRG
ncbi:hypothetical protein JQM70_13680, partial [Streptococcus pasteurianus]|nr:hypothetical protein [Streptococcus pasteurianus]